jgi:hypothetical protein
MVTYKIVKYYKDPTKKARVVRTGLTLEEAQEHCRKDSTHGIDWYDGYTKE